jgi:prephenate dehydrogenase
MEVFQKEFDDIKSFIEKEEWDELYDFMQSANTLHKIL